MICSKSDGRLMQCKDAESWARFYRVGLIKQRRQILDLSTGEKDFPQSHVCNTKLEHRRSCVASKHLEQIKGNRKRFVAPESEH